RDRRVRGASRWDHVRRAGRIPPGPADAQGRVPVEPDREASDVRARERTGAPLRHARGSPHRARVDVRRVSLVGADSEHCHEHAVSDEELCIMIVTKKHIPRRTMLRGMGVSLALPLLDGMVPALTALRVTAAAPVKRFAAVYIG